MAYVFGYNLSYHSERILETLLVYRGMTAKQLTALMYVPFQFSLSEEKSVYNYLRKLKEQGLVSAFKLQANVANGSIYYLTPKGYEYAKNMKNISEGAVGSGWIERYRDYEESNLGDLPYDLYSPPIKQPAHHLMLIDFFIRMNMIDEDDYGTITHRLNLYAAKTYEMDGHKYRYRPDGEIVIGNKKFAIEIDRATESHEQLLQKMETYKRYLDYCAANEHEKNGELDGIIFVVESKRRAHGIKRRWTNILAASFKGLLKYQGRLNVIMTSLDMVEKTIIFEMKRNAFEKEARKKIEDVLKEKGYLNVSSWRDSITHEAVFSHGMHQHSYRVFFNAISQEFESRLYIRYMDFLNNRLSFATNPEKSKSISNLEYEGYGKNVFYDQYKPYIVENLSYYDVDNKMISMLDGLKKDTHFYDFTPQFSVFE